MNLLAPDQRLNVGELIGSDNGLWHLVLQADGNLVLYRSHFGRAVWASNTVGRPIAFVAMQGDGNFVAYENTGAPAWATNTDGNPGALIQLGDDGNLVLSRPGQRPLWTSNTSENVNSPTFMYSDGGYGYVEVAEWLKDVASNFPCSAVMEWPGYDTEIVEDTINGQPVVIQLWKGWCPKFVDFMPGGVGAEVGIYRRIPGKPRPTPTSVWDQLANAVSDFIGSVFGAVNAISGITNSLLKAFKVPDIAPLSDNDVWWPAPELNAQIEYTFINSRTGQTVFTGGPLRSYWLPKWMNNESYFQYQRDQGPGNTSDFLNTTDYWLEYRINGKSYPRWPPRDPAEAEVATPVAELVQPSIDLLLGTIDVLPRPSPNPALDLIGPNTLLL